MAANLEKLARQVEREARKSNNSKFKAGASALFSIAKAFRKEELLPESVDDVQGTELARSTIVFEASPRYYTAAEAAEQIGCTLSNIRKLSRSGRFEAVKKSGAWVIPTGIIDNYKRSNRGPKRKSRV